MEGIWEETSGWTASFETEQGLVFISISLIMAMKQDLSALKSWPAFKSQESKISASRK